MSEFLVILVGSFLAGLAAKIADELEKIRKFSIIAYFSSLTYATILGILSCFFNLATLYVGLALSNAIAGKIDSKTHLLGFFIFTFLISAFGANIAQPWFLGLFFIGGFLDEIFSNSKFFILRQRLILPLIALLILLFSSNSIYFFSIVSFDFGYKIFIFLKPKIIKILSKVVKCLT